MPGRHDTCAGATNRYVVPADSGESGWRGCGFSESGGVGPGDGIWKRCRGGEGARRTSPGWPAPGRGDREQMTVRLREGDCK